MSNLAVSLFPVLTSGAVSAKPFGEMSPNAISDELSTVNVGEGLDLSLQKDPNVKAVQDALIALGLLNLKGNTSDGKSADGKFGNLTLQAVRAFRNKTGSVDTSKKITQSDVDSLLGMMMSAKKDGQTGKWVFDWRSPSSQIVESDKSDEKDQRIAQLETDVKDLQEKTALHDNSISQVQEQAVSESKKEPGWYDKMNLRGDLRFRYQMDRNSAGQAKNRLRIRGRLGADFELDEKTSLHAGIATGSGDPRSTNQTLEGEFKGKQINLDHAYAKYQFAPWGNIKAGKIKQEEVLWQPPTELVWDSDINPEGAAVNFSQKFGKDGKAEVFANAGYLVFGKSDFDLNGPSVMFGQLGGKLEFGKGFYAKASLEGYHFDGFKGLSSPFSTSAGTNTVRTVYSYSYDEETNEVTRTEESKTYYPYGFNSVGGSFDAGYKVQDGALKGKVASVYGNVIHNMDAPGDNTGYAVGLKFGDEKADDKGKWEARVMYEHLEKDSVPDTLPNSDFRGGKTGVQGIKVGAAYGLSKNVSLAGTYYNTSDIADPDNREQVVQLDVNLRFGSSKRKKGPAVPSLEPPKEADKA